MQREEQPKKMETEIGVNAAANQGVPRIASKQKLRNMHETDSSRDPSEIAWSCRHPDFGFRTSRPVRK